MVNGKVSVPNSMPVTMPFTLQRIDKAGVVTDFELMQMYISFWGNGNAVTGLHDDDDDDDDHDVDNHKVGMKQCEGQWHGQCQGQWQ